MEKKTKQETIAFLQSIVIELKNDYGYDETVIMKVLQHLKYQEGIYEDKSKSKTT